MRLRNNTSSNVSKITKRSWGGIAALLTFMVLAAPLGAIPVTGHLGWSGDGLLTFSSGGLAGPHFIDFCPVNVGPEPGTGCGVTAGAGGVITVGSRSGSFVAVDPSGSPGTILDITDTSPSPNPNYTFIPVGPGLTPNFLNFADPWLYTLTEISPQVCAPGVDQLCTGYFRLTQTSPTTVSVDLAGRGFITAGPDNSPFTLLLNGHFTNVGGVTIADVVNAANSPSGAFTFSWSGQLDAVGIPEPGTTQLILCGIGLVTVGLFRRRRRVS
jgi:hypothetical protein